MITGYSPEALTPPYWSPSKCDKDATTHFDEDRVPVYTKPVDIARLQPFFVRAAASESLRKSPAALRDAVVTFALQRQLTAQQTRVLAQLAGGSTRSSLPNDLKLSSDTVKSQIRTLLHKCSVGTTDELIAALLKHISRADAS